MNDAPIKADMSLIGINGNAFAIIAAVERGLRRAGATSEQRAQFRNEAMSGDFSNLLATAMKWTDDENEGDE